MILVYKRTKALVQVGDTASFPGTPGPLVVAGFRPPGNARSQGKVTILRPNGSQEDYFVSSLGAEWIEREDRT